MITYDHKTHCQKGTALAKTGAIDDFRGQRDPIGVLQVRWVQNGGVGLLNDLMGTESTRKLQSIAVLLGGKGVVVNINIAGILALLRGSNRSLGLLRGRDRVQILAFGLDNLRLGIFSLATGLAGLGGSLRLLTGLIGSFGALSGGHGLENC